MQVPWDAVDTWIEEGRELVHYPPNPYHRVDCRPTNRALRVVVAGTTLVDTSDTMVVFETALAPVLYVDPSHVRTDLLHRSTTSSYCNYKGYATYWSAVIGDTRRRRRRMELWRPVARNPAHQGIFQLRRGSRGRRRRIAGGMTRGRHRGYQTRIQSTSICAGYVPGPGSPPPEPAIARFKIG